MVNVSYNMQPTATNRARIMREMKRRKTRAYYRAEIKDIAIRALIVTCLMSVLGTTYLLATA